MTDLSPAVRNARNRACKRYLDWLHFRYHRLDVVELAADDPSLADPISLRKIFVPLRVDTKDLDDEKVGDGKGEDIDTETLPGADAFDVLLDDPFVVLSGRPGSGKSTLVQALIVELCGEHPSPLRQRLRALPVPFILRTFEGLDTITNLDDLISAWWPAQLAQAKHDGLPLDQERLHRALFEPLAKQRDLPVLLLFDGVDEIGGPAVRQRLYDIAREARGRGYRVLITGRPAGFDDVTIRPRLSGKARAVAEGPTSPLRHVLPFGWCQIEQFIDKWYGLRDDWLRDRDEGMKRFLDHLRTPDQRQLLTLARRPIFLTLMALVNCTQSEMPQGRARLYRMILELYLNRQERYRQRQGSVDRDGEATRRWPASETRLVLAHVAWLSQDTGSRRELEDGSDTRRVVWSRKDLEKTIRQQLSGVGPGRFRVLGPGDAGTLIQYYLHPTGLLTAPTDGEIQFAHLSFQEYLCALFLYDRAKLEGLVGRNS